MGHCGSANPSDINKNAQKTERAGIFPKRAGIFPKRAGISRNVREFAPNVREFAPNVRDFSPNVREFSGSTEKLDFLVFSSFQVENVKSDENLNEIFEETAKILGLTCFGGIWARRRKFLSFDFVVRLGIEVVQGGSNIP